MGVAVPVAGSVPRSAAHRRAALGIGIAATALATVAAAAIAAEGAGGHPELVAAGRAAIVGVPCAVGLYAWYRGLGQRFGPLLVAAGGVWLVATLAESNDPAAYTTGRVAGWIAELFVVYLALAFPTGRLPGRADRLIVASMAAVLVVTFLPRLLFAASFEVPTVYTSCASDCPPNALFALHREPAFIADVLRPVGSVLVLAVMLAVVARLWARVVAASPLVRHMFVPLLTIAALRSALLGAGISVRLVDPAAPGLQAVGWLLALAVPAMALAFLAGLLRWRLFTADALTRLAVHLGGDPHPSAFRRAFSEAFGDPSVTVAFPAPGDRQGVWVDAGGRPVELPGAGCGHAVTVVDDGHGPAVAIVHDEALRSQPLLLRAGAAIAGTALDRQRLATEAREAMVEVRRSRARIAASAERERRRLERDLHDGAQQRLVALRIELQLAEDLVRRDPVVGARRLHELEADLDVAIDELRSLAHGVYPAVLADRGLVDGLRAATRRSPVPVEVEAHDVGRFRPEIESAAYFCVLEACQNALKHAGGARRIEVDLHRTDGELRFSVRDDGAGMDGGAGRTGRGLTNMRDRVAAVGGTIEILSAPHVGTEVRGRVPLAAPDSSA